MANKPINPREALELESVSYGGGATGFESTVYGVINQLLAHRMREVGTFTHRSIVLVALDSIVDELECLGVKRYEMRDWNMPEIVLKYEVVGWVIFPAGTNYEHFNPDGWLFKPQKPWLLPNYSGPLLG